jgi:uncharacterized protein (TIGR02145 family)
MRNTTTKLALSLLGIAMLFFSCEQEKATLEDETAYPNLSISNENLVGSWHYASSEAIVLNLCSDGLFKIVQYNPVGEVQIDESGSWNYENSNISLQANDGYSEVFKVEKYEITDSSTNLWIHNNETIVLTLQPDEPCNLTDTTGGGSTGGETESTFTDTRDNKTYSIMKVGNLWWMLDNFAYNYAGSNQKATYLQEGVTDIYGNPSYVTYYIDKSWELTPDDHAYPYGGRYYSYKAAENAAPQGWRLPTLKEYYDALANEELGATFNEKFQEKAYNKRCSEMPSDQWNPGVSYDDAIYGTGWTSTVHQSTVAGQTQWPAHKTFRSSAFDYQGMGVRYVKSY